ncbi:MAG: hypothetical protein F4Y02_06655 [Chloroflexi bacterium]|nr:hypothetical protein [Chloroflexota bacterium]
MTAWVIRLKWFGDHAAVAHPVVDIVSARRGETYICDYLQRLHDLLFLSVGERSRLERYTQAEPRPYEVTVAHTANGPEATVGHNPCLAAQKLNNLTVEVDAESGDEIVTSDALGTLRVLDLREALHTPT